MMLRRRRFFPKGGANHANDSKGVLGPRCFVRRGRITSSPNALLIDIDINIEFSILILSASPHLNIKRSNSNRKVRERNQLAQNNQISRKNPSYPRYNPQSQSFGKVRSFRPSPHRIDKFMAFRREQYCNITILQCRQIKKTDKDNNNIQDLLAAFLRPSPFSSFPYKDDRVYDGA